jgi:steroid 5-alpha reductase family enzyme
LVIDDLRDYRFYAEDMVHPNYAATQYVWEKFIQTAIDKNATKTMETIASLMLARLHKPFHPHSEAHQRFLQARIEDATRLQETHSYLNLQEMIAYFRMGLQK